MTPDPNTLAEPLQQPEQGHGQLLKQSLRLRGSGMRRRLLFVVGCVALVLAGGLLLFWWTDPSRHICRETYERLEFGMSEEDVGKLIPLPPGNYESEEVVVSRITDIKGVFPDARISRKAEDGSVVRLDPVSLVPFGNYKTWTSERGKIGAWFDVDGKLVGKLFFECVPTGKANLLQRLIRLVSKLL